ncbi:hypothetical protein CVIRNUC_005314 [Coccomyxa viridis]|uniref:DUF7794 domain-containing protein n=1 Tax=Coccomyxa viridis TaxID=1274662 RepID=A0AAV1I5Q0_9CHLO|nr:hypothetical protein CVIRNUC_005314 [Coccomyxa viridis]
MRTTSMLGLISFALALSSSLGVEQTYLSGPTLRSASKDLVQMSPQDLNALLVTLTGQRPQQSVSPQTSHQMDMILRPSVGLQPSSLLSLHISGVQSLEKLVMGEQAHQLSIEGLDKTRSNPVASLLSQGLSAGSLEHRPIGTSFSCSNACLEQLLKEALLPLEGNYTAAEQPFKGIAALQPPSGAAPVELSLRQTAAQAWATEMALLHASGMSLDAQAANQQQGATNMEKPIVMEGTLQSPKLLAATHGDSAPETSAAVSALGGAIKQLQRQLSSVYDNRVAMHLVTSDEPLKRVDMKAALATKDSQGRRRLLSSVTASKPSRNARDGVGFMNGAMAWISAILFLVFGIAACRVLAGMEFKQDSLLYGRAKTD